MHSSLHTYTELITYVQIITYAELPGKAGLWVGTRLRGALSRKELFVGAHLSIITLWGAFLAHSTFCLLPSLERPDSWTLPFPETLVWERHSNDLVSAC